MRHLGHEKVKSMIALATAARGRQAIPQEALHLPAPARAAALAHPAAVQPQAAVQPATPVQQAAQPPHPAVSSRQEVQACIRRILIISLC